MKKLIYTLPIIVLMVAGCTPSGTVTDNLPVNSTTLPPGQGGGGIVCTQEVKLCPNGGSVGRVSPNCEFAPCPTQKQSTSTSNSLPPNQDGSTFCTQEVKLCPNGSYVGRTSLNCAFAPCPIEK